MKIKKMNLTIKFAIALSVVLLVSSILTGILILPVIKNKVLQADYETLYSKERIVTQVINEDELWMLQYVKDIQSLSKLFTSAFEFTDYLKEHARNFDLSNIAILNLNKEIVFSILDVQYNHESEINAISRAIKGESSVVKTVTDVEVLFTSAGKISLLGNDYVILFQRQISDNSYLTQLAEETDTTITLYHNDMIIGTSTRDERKLYFWKI